LGTPHEKVGGHVQLFITSSISRFFCCLKAQDIDDASTMAKSYRIVNHLRFR
jgi:hypothetical protein